MPWGGGLPLPPAPAPPAQPLPDPVNQWCSCCVESCYSSGHDEIAQGRDTEGRFNCLMGGALLEACQRWQPLSDGRVIVMFPP